MSPTSSRPDPALLAATVGTGLMAGLYLAFDVGVMPALARRDDEAFVSAMRRVNDALDDSASFGALFLGVFVATGVAAPSLRRAERDTAARRAGAAAVLYGLSIVVTIGANLPLNHAAPRRPGGRVGGGDGRQDRLRAAVADGERRPYGRLPGGARPARRRGPAAGGFPGVVTGSVERGAGNRRRFRAVGRRTRRHDGAARTRPCGGRRPGPHPLAGPRWRNGMR